MGKAKTVKAESKGKQFAPMSIENEKELSSLISLHASRPCEDGKRNRENTLAEKSIKSGTVHIKNTIVWTAADIKKIVSLAGSKPHNEDTYAVVREICKRNNLTEYVKTGKTKNDIPIYTGTAFPGTVVTFPSRNREMKQGNFSYLLNRILSQVLAESKGTMNRKEGNIHIYKIV